VADRLRTPHLQIALDQYVTPQSINEEWSRWCEKQLELADHVIIITEIYRRRFQREEHPCVGCGASFEAKLIYDDLYARRGINPKYRVVLLDALREQCIPPPSKATIFSTSTNPQATHVSNNGTRPYRQQRPPPPQLQSPGRPKSPVTGI
jgi:hypothetical protein